VIVSCPRCHKQYRLDVSRLNYTRLPDNSGQGVQLACSNCHEQWWELKKESINTNQSEYKAAVPEQPFRNLTDISLLYQRQSANYAYQTLPNEQNIPLVSRTEDRNYAQQSIPQKEPKSQKWRSVLRIGLWSFIILGGTITIALVAMKFNPSSSLIPITEHAQKPVTPGEVSIENIQFDIKPIDEEHQRIIVVGNVKNPGPMAIPLRNIQLTAWGTCLQGQIPNEQGLCQIRVWPYKWKQDLLQPGEQLTFKSAAKIQANLQVDQVHVDVETN
jgi:hypothetical protein